MELLEKILRFSHAFSGRIVLLTGLLAIVVKPRGGNFHKKVGITYFYGMLWIFLSSAFINMLFNFSFFLSMISVFSFYLCFSAYRTLKRKKPNQVSIIDWVGAIFTILCGLGFVGFGIYVFATTDKTILALLNTFFGLFTIRVAWQDITIFKKEEYDEKMWWYYHHAGNMMGSFIAAVTAFAVNVMPGLTPSFDYNWTYWIIPTIIGFPVLNSILKKERERFSKK